MYTWPENGGRALVGALATAVALFCSACDSGTGSKPTEAKGVMPIAAVLVQAAQRGSAADRNAAIYLAADVELDDEQIQSVVTSCTEDQKVLGDLFCSYFDYSRTQSPGAAERFVRAYPSTEDALRIAFTEATPLIMPGKLIVLLANLAADNDEALRKLAQSAARADGWVAEESQAALDELRGANAQRVDQLLRTQERREGE